MAKYIIHKAVELSKLSTKNRPTEEQLNTRSYIWQPKVDGCNMVAIVNHGNVTLLSRTGEFVLSANNIARELAPLPSGVYLGEYAIPNTPFPIISGHFRNQQVQVEAEFYIFDVLPLAEYNKGKSYTPYHSRMAHIPSVHPSSPLKAIYYGSRTRVEAWMAAHPELSYDGLIARRADGLWIQGSSGLTGEIIKVKNIHSLDLTVTGIKTAKGVKTNRNVYTLVVDYSGQEVTVGSGVPHLKADLPKIGQIVEVEFLGITTTGMLREPRFKGIRHDKLEPDS